MSNLITTLVGDEVEGYDKWCGTLAAPNGSVYGIPHYARRVAKFNPIDKSMTHIGPDFGGGAKWSRGAMTNNGIIYCLPTYSRRGILKIDTNTDTATVLDINLLPEHRDYYMWKSCAAALDGCIYCMPFNARRIMKLDPNNSDAISSVGDDLGPGCAKYVGTVVGIDGCVYGIPGYADIIRKYDPINKITSFVGEKADEYFKCNGSGALARDGCIYAIANYKYILKIDTVNNSHCIVGVHDAEMTGDSMLGIDGCIYWPPCDDGYTLKYDPHSKQTSCVGSQFEIDENNWLSGALATDGVIYCIPTLANQVLAIDPIGEFLATTKANMQDHPEKFGCLFQTIEVDEDSVPSLANFDLAVVKFGQNTVFEVLEKAMKPVNDYCKESNLCPFMIAASYKESPVCVINHLLRRDLSWVNDCISS